MLELQKTWGGEVMNYQFPEVTVVGSINVDVNLTVDHLPLPGEKVTGTQLTRTLGGKGANQAVAAAMLGAQVSMVGALGADVDGAWAYDQLEAQGIDTSQVREVDLATGTAMILTEPEGEHSIAMAPGANEGVSIAGVQFPANGIILAQLEIGMDVIEELADITPGFLVLNAAPARSLPTAVVDGADLIIVSDSELSIMPSIAGAKRTVVTYGDRGAAYFEYEHEVARTPGFPVEGVYSIGAIDAFTAAFALAFRSGIEPLRSLEIASAVGADVALVPHAQAPLKPLNFYAASVD